MSQPFPQRGQSLHVRAVLLSDARDRYAQLLLVSMLLWCGSGHDTNSMGVCCFRPVHNDERR